MSYGRLPRQSRKHRNSAGPTMRVAVIESTPAKRISADLSVAPSDFDEMVWHSDGRRRIESEAKALVAEVAAGMAG